MDLMIYKCKTLLLLFALICLSSCGRNGHYKERHTFSRLNSIAKLIVEYKSIEKSMPKNEESFLIWVDKKYGEGTVKKRNLLIDSYGERIIINFGDSTTEVRSVGLDGIIYTKDDLVVLASERER